MNRGTLETLKTVLYVGLLGVLIGILYSCIAGCSGTSAGLKVEHHSSAQDYYDSCEDNLAGFDLRFPLGKGSSPYRPELEFGLGWDFRGGACQGRDPIGEAQLRFPLWVKR